MILSPSNRDVAILQDIRQTLQQIRPSSKSIEKVVVPSGTTSVSIYTDAARTNLLATDSSPVISTVNGKTYYTPPDATLNTTGCLPVYYLTCQPSATAISYRNLDNLLFERVVVATKTDPKYLASGNAAVLVPGVAKTVDKTTNDDLSQVLLSYDLTVRLNVPDWTNLSEENRVVAYMQTSNCIRLALMQDRYRGANATLYNADVDGTFVSDLTPLDSKDTMRGRMKIKCCYWTSPTSY